MSSTSSSSREDLLKLLEAKKDINEVLRRHKLLLESIKEENIREASIDDILLLAANSTPTVYAPKGWRPGCPVGHPPAPRIEQMRCGLLGKLGVDLGLQISEKHNFSIEANDTVIENASMQLGSCAESDEDTNISTIKETVEEVVEPQDTTFDSSTGSSVNRFQRTSNTNASKKRHIDMNYGFSSDSSSDTEDEQ